MFIDQSLVQQTVYTNQDIETLSQKKVPGKAYKNVYIYDLHNLAPSPSKALYIQLGMKNFIAVCTRILIMLNLSWLELIG